MELPIQKQFGSVLVKFCCQHTRNAYCWNPLVKRFQESKSTPFKNQPLGSCGATVLKLSSCRQGWSTYMDSIDKQQDVLLGLYQVSYIYLQAITAVERALLTEFLIQCSFQTVLFLSQLWHHGITENHLKVKRLLNDKSFGRF